MQFDQIPNHCAVRYIYLQPLHRLFFPSCIHLFLLQNNFLCSQTNTAFGNCALTEA